MRVLVVEDEADLARTLGRALSEEGYAVDMARTGDDALSKATAVLYDTVVLDLLLPGMRGLLVLSALRAAGVRTPVLILTARDAVDDKVRGLNAGADDYMTKPFALTELLARVRALIRRASPDPVPDLAAGPLVMDTSARVVRRDGKVIVSARDLTVLVGRDIGDAARAGRAREPAGARREVDRRCTRGLARVRERAR